MAFLQLADLQWIYYRQNVLLGYLFGEITAVKIHPIIVKIHPIIVKNTYKIGLMV